MENITYEMYKDDIMFHSGTCPMMLFVNVLPLQDKELYDYIIITYKNKIIKFKGPAREIKWK